MSHLKLFIFFTLTAFFLNASQVAAIESSDYSLKELKTIEGFDVPECVLHDPKSLSDRV